MLVSVLHSFLQRLSKWRFQPLPHAKPASSSSGRPWRARAGMLRVTCNGRHGQFDGAAWLEGRHKVFYDEENGAEGSSDRALFLSEFAALAGVWDKKACARFIRLVDSGESFEEYRLARAPERRAARERKALNPDEVIYIDEPDEQSPRAKRALNKRREAEGVTGHQGGGIALAQEVTAFQGSENAPQSENARADVSTGVEKAPDTAPQGAKSRKRTRKGKEKVDDDDNADVSKAQDDAPGEDPSNNK